MTSQADNPGRKWTPPEDRAIVDVNLDEKDASKAIERRKEAHLPPSEEERDDPETRFLNRSSAVKKRINRIQRQFDQRMAERDAEHQREISALREDFNKLGARKVETVAPDEAAHDRAIAALQSDLAAAHEAGESKKVAELTAKINRLEGEYWHKKTVAQMGAQEKPAAVTPPAARQEQSRVPTGPTATAKKWMRANEWWDDPDFAGERAYANAIFAQLVEDDEMDADDPDTFKELGKRMAKKFKDLEVIDPEAKRGKRKPKDEDDEDEEEELEVRGNKRAPVMQVDRGTAQVRRGRGVTLNASDTAAMKQFGLDPNDDAHVLRWAAEKQATEEA